MARLSDLELPVWAWRRCFPKCALWNPGFVGEDSRENTVYTKSLLEESHYTGSQ